MGSQQDSVQDTPTCKIRGFCGQNSQGVEIQGRVCRGSMKNWGPQSTPENSCYGKSQPGLVDHTCYPSIWGAEAEG